VSGAFSHLPCPLCSSSALAFFQQRARAFHECPECRLIFADPASHVSPEREKAEYDLHRNHPEDAGYRRFLSRLAEPLIERLKPGMEGLDYGCGPGPVLGLMLQEAGMRVAAYDPIYAPDTSHLSRQYDFLTCTEVVEHFREPATEWARMLALVRPGGWLGIMTQPVISRERFVNWQYKNDPTHVSFHAEASFDWIARQYGLLLERPARDVFLLRTRQESQGGTAS